MRNIVIETYVIVYGRILIYLVPFEFQPIL